MPSGLSKDGASSVYHRVQLPAGAAAAVEGKSELDALIAYLQGLGTNLKAGT